MSQALAEDTAMLRMPAPFWKVTAILCLVLLTGVMLSFVVFFYTFNQVNVAVARQIERPVVKAVAQIQGTINSTSDMLRSLQQVMRLSPGVSGDQLGDFTAAVNQTQVLYAGLYMVQIHPGQDDKQVSLLVKSEVALPRRLLEDQEGFAKILAAEQHSGGIVSASWRQGTNDYVALAERCAGTEQQCFLIAILPLKSLLSGLDVLTDNKFIGGYALYEQGPEDDGSARRAMRLFVRNGNNADNKWSLFDQQISSDHIVLQDKTWSVRYYAQPDQGSQMVLLLPYLVIVIGLLMTGGCVIYVINNYEYQKEVFTLTHSLRESNTQLQEKIGAETAMAEALRVSERKFRGIFENAGIGICQIEPNKQWLAANRRIAAMLGYRDPQELLREQPDRHDALFVDHEARQKFLTGLGRDEQSDVELAVRRRDGATLWVNMRGHVIRDAEDAPLYYECTMYDVTQRRSSEQALFKAKEQADFANRSKSEFLANMSHELRTPLNAIIGFSEIIKDQLLGPEGTPQYIEYAKDIHDSGALLLSLINDILDMSKIEAGKRALSETSIDIDRIVQSCARLVAVRAKAGGLQLRQEIPPNLQPLRGEERAIKQVLVNLMTNAIKFTPEGGMVTAKAHLDPFGRMCIAVTDTGIGIAPEDIPTALAPFGQIESAMSRRTQGTGLGLPLTKALVELHGGELQISSAVGQGTTVTIVFPADRVITRIA